MRMTPTIASLMRVEQPFYCIPSNALRRLLRPFLATLLHIAGELLAPLVEQRRELVAEAVHRPRRALLRERKPLVHSLLLARNRGRTTGAVDNRLVRLAGGDEVHAVLGDFLVAPHEVLKAQHVDREEGRAHEVFAPEAPPGPALEQRILELLLRPDRHAHRVTPLRDALGQGMPLGITPCAPRRYCLPDKQEEKQDADTDDHVARLAERLALHIERIEAAAQRAHLLAVEQLVLEIIRPRGELPFGGRGFVARGAHDEKVLADRERGIRARLLAARLDAAMRVNRVLADPRVDDSVAGDVGVVARRERDIADGIEIRLRELVGTA